MQFEITTRAEGSHRAHDSTSYSPLFIPEESSQSSSRICGHVIHLIYVYVAHMFSNHTQVFCFNQDLHLPPSCVVAMNSAEPRKYDYPSS